MDEEREADQWWESQMPRRKVQIWRFLSKPDPHSPIVPGQMPLFDEKEESA